MKKDFKRLYTYGLIMIICVIAIVIIAAMSQLESTQAIEDKLTQNLTQIENLEKRIADLEEEKHELEKKLSKNSEAEAKLEKAEQSLNDLTEIYKLAEAGELEKAKEKLDGMDTNGFSDAALAFYGALDEILNK